MRAFVGAWGQYHRLGLLHAGRSRCICTTRTRTYQHVLYFGNVLGYHSIDKLAKLPRAWLDSVGVSADVDHGLTWTAASGSPGHVLLSYTLLDRAVDPAARRARLSTEELATSDQHLHESAKRDNGQGKDGEEAVTLDDVEGQRSTSSQPSKVFALGRNTHAQLGLGFSSQEATRGMVTGQMEGKGGVSTIVAGHGFSFVVTAESEASIKGDGQARLGASNVYVFGNDTLGQLASTPASMLSNIHEVEDPYDISTRHPESGAPQLKLLPLPKKLEIDDAGWRVKDLAAGLDHSVVLLERELNGLRIRSVRSTGLNTDGQLGLTPREKADAVPIEPLLSRQFQAVPGLPINPVAIHQAAGQDGEEEITAVVCGADTSYALTRSGDLWVWGNSEYGQSFAGVQDRIANPTFVPNPLSNAYAAYGLEFTDSTSPRIAKLVAGGSFAGILDTSGRVWMVGYGPRGSSTDSSDPAEWAKLTLVTGLPDDVVAEDLFCGLEYVVAVTRSRDQNELGVWIWGIAPRSISSHPIRLPTRVPFSIPKTPRQQWLDENPRLNKASATCSDRGGGNRASVRVKAAACTRDHLLLVLDDGIGDEVWAECVQPPRAKGTDMAL